MRHAEVSALMTAADRKKDGTRASPHGSARRLLSLAVMLASLGGLAWLVAAEHDELGRALTGMSHAKIGLVVGAIACERISMWSFARMQQRLLRAGGHHLSSLSVISITFAANALSVTVPLAGPGLATAFAYQEFGRHQVSRSAAAFTLAVGGVLSTVSLTVILAAGALVSGNLLAAILGLLAAAGTMAGIVAALLALRLPAIRQPLKRAAAGAVRVVQRLRRKPASPPETVVAAALRELAGLRLRRADWVLAVAFAFLNWLADAACLALSIRAAGPSIPFRYLLLVWSVGLAASSTGLTPGGVGIVEAALIAALTGIGMPATQATVAVMIYRLISLWLVILSGWIIFLIIRSRRTRRPEQRPRPGSPQWRGE
jgi:putative heme transporter